MDKKILNKEIRKISNSSSLPLLLYIVFSNIIIYGFTLICYIFSDNSLLADYSFQELVLYTGIYLVTIPLVLIIYQKSRGRKIGLSFGSLFKKPQKSVGWCAVWIIIGCGLTYAASFISNIIYTLIQSLFNIELYEAEISFGDSLLGIVLTLVAPPIFAPVFEELLFRGVVYRNNEPMGQMFAIVVTGIAFGLWHENYSQLIYTAVLGMFSCFLLAKTRSIVPSMILHFIVNTISTVNLIALMNAGIDNINELTANAESLLTNHPFVIMIIAFMEMCIIGLLIAGIALFIVQLAKHHGKTGLKRSVFPVGNARKIAAYFTAPITLIVFVLMIFMTVFNAIFR